MKGRTYKDDSIELHPWGKKERDIDEKSNKEDSINGRGKEGTKEGGGLSRRIAGLGATEEARCRVVGMSFCSY